MQEFGPYPMLQVVLDDDHVATIEMQNGELNFFNIEMLAGLADALDVLDANNDCRVVVLASAGRAFSAGADFQGGRQGAKPVGLQTKNSEKGVVSGHLYDQAVRLFANKKPIIGAVEGAAIGGGLGLALVPDFRIGCAEARFSANFTQLGFHPGFGLTYTLPKLIGQQRAYDMFYTGRRVKGEEALQMGLIDQLVPLTDVRQAANDKALQVASSAPLAVVSVRETLRANLAEHVRVATQRELQEQNWLMRTDDAKEGVIATAERRPGIFKGK